MFDRIRDPIRRLGAANGVLYLLSRFLNTMTRGRCRLIRYYIVAQPITSAATPTCRPSPGTTIEQALPGEEVCSSFPRPKQVIDRRFREGHTCFVAKVKGRFAGFLWLARNAYEEDEVRCRFELDDPGRSAWDFDVYVEPEFRMGRTFVRLWGAVNQLLWQEGVRWSFSRISAFNADSLHAHDRLHARRIDTLTFLCLGSLQFTLKADRPFVGVCWPGRPHPVVRLRSPNRLPPHATERPFAVVVGLCAHGLGMVRSLSRSGVPVLALETDRTLPGVRTNRGVIRFVDDINGPGLVEVLLDLANELGPGAEKPVLILTNDRMVKTVGENVERLAPRYRISWAKSAPHVLNLLGKDHIERRCRETGLSCPESTLLIDADTIERDVAALAFPIILKPTRPLSAFKALVIESPEAIAKSRNLIAQCLPVLAQEFIPGDDRAIRFGALYLRDGEVLARFEGRKLCSRPMGHTTIGISEPNDEVHRLAMGFFRGLRLSGPVSLELKQGPDGRFWVIEPTVGRTDFWEGLCSANGVSLPLLEYLSEAGLPVPAMAQQCKKLWINGERHPTALAWLSRHEPRTLLRQRVRGVYLDVADPKPFLLSATRWIRRLTASIARRVTGRSANA